MHPSYVNQTPRKGDKHSRKRKTLIDIRPNAQDYIIKQYKEKSKKKRSTNSDIAESIKRIPSYCIILNTWDYLFCLKDSQQKYCIFYIHHKETE